MLEWAYPPLSGQFWLQSDFFCKSPPPSDFVPVGDWRGPKILSPPPIKNLEKKPCFRPMPKSLQRLHLIHYALIIWLYKRPIFPIFFFSCRWGSVLHRMQEGWYLFGWWHTWTFEGHDSQMCVKETNSWRLCTEEQLYCKDSMFCARDIPIHLCETITLV